MNERDFFEEKKKLNRFANDYQGRRKKEIIKEENYLLKKDINNEAKKLPFNPLRLS